MFVLKPTTHTHDSQGVAELRRELVAAQRLSELPEIHQFLDGFYLSRIGIRILIGESHTSLATAWLLVSGLGRGA